MPVTIPFLTSDSNYYLNCPIDDELIQIYVRWNSRDEAFYLDMYESDNTIIALNIKVVVGIPLGRRSQHDFFQQHKLTAVDTTNQGLDPQFDELGQRVVLVIQNQSDLLE